MLAIEYRTEYTVPGHTDREVATAVPRTFKFPGGESHVVLPDEMLAKADCITAIKVVALLKNADLVMQLLLLTDALRRQIPAARYELVIPYLPYGRQDRVAYPGEPLSIKVFANLINSLAYDQVVVMDPHSDVGPALLDRVRVVTAQRLVAEALKDEAFKYGVTLLAPDAGARKRTLSLAQKLGTVGKVKVAFADKIRNVHTGAITGTQFPADIDAELPVLVVDDICDGGRTFTELASAAREAGVTNPLYLYVTHGIFSKGVGVLVPHFTKIFTAYDWTESSDAQLVIVGR